MRTTYPAGEIVYQIYPRSFQDTDGDGIGNIAGITRRLEHIKAIGATTIWLSPFYPSPQHDFSYDIADYCDVNPEYGTLDEFKDMVAAAHALDMKIWVDLVPNHTSDEHTWFTESAKGKDNPYSDWYVWRDAGSNGEAPNNWLDVLSGEPAWQWHEGRQQYYLHSFNVHQPDLNWENPAVVAAMQDVMLFWLDLGVDGFRVDAVYWLAKDPDFKDDPVNSAHDPTRHDRYDSLIHQNSTAWPKVYDHLRSMAAVLTKPAYSERQPFMVIEAYPISSDHLNEYMRFYDEINPSVAAPFNFENFNLTWSASAWADFLSSYHEALTERMNAVASYAFGNHDQPRLASRLGEVDARLAAVLQYCLPGMSFIYNGDELGMLNGVIPADKIHDPAANGGWGRDPARTPMQWDVTAQAGFTDGASSWLPVSDDYQKRNAISEAADPESFLNLYRTLGRLRQSSSALLHGDIKVIGSGDDVLVFERYAADQTYRIVLNFGTTDQLINIPNEAKTVFTSQPLNTDGTLAAKQALIVQL